MKRQPSIPCMWCFLVALVIPFAAAEADMIGQIQSDSASLNGTIVPSGTALPLGAHVGAHDAPAVLHLDGGKVVRLAERSSVTFAAGGPGEVEFTVQSGTVMLKDGEGELVALGAGSGATFFADEPPIGEGAPVESGATASDDEEVEICHLRNPTPQQVQLCTVDDPDNSKCRWQKLDVNRSKLEEHLAHGDVYRDRSRRTPEMDREIVCRRGVFILLPGEAAAIGGSVLVLGLALDDDDGRPASPVSP